MEWAGGNTFGLPEHTASVTSTGGTIDRYIDLRPGGKGQNGRGRELRIQKHWEESWVQVETTCKPKTTLK